MRTALPCRSLLSREFAGNSRDSDRSRRIKLGKTGPSSKAYDSIPYGTEQGIFVREQENSFPARVPLCSRFVEIAVKGLARI